MKLEEEIKQKEFRNDFHKLAVNIIYTYGWLNNIQLAKLKKFGLSSQQFNILRILRGQHPKSASINLLKERMLDKMSDTSRIVERMRIKGLLERHICEKDRRRVDVVITQEGLNLLSEIDQLDSEFDATLNKLTIEEASALNHLMDKMRG